MMPIEMLAFVRYFAQSFQSRAMPDRRIVLPALDSGSGEYEVRARLQIDVWSKNTVSAPSRKIRALPHNSLTKQFIKKIYDFR